MFKQFRSIALVVTALCIALSVSGHAQAALFADWDVPAATNTQSGYVDIRDVLGTGNTVDAGDVGSMVGEGTQTATDTRDRGAITGTHASLSNLLRDFGFNGNGAPPLDVSLKHINAGTYTFTGYFHDSDVDHGTQTISYSVDGGGSFAVGASNVTISTTSSPAAFGSASFNFTANGTDDVVFRFANDGGGVDILNGFDITGPGPVTAPEPSTLMLAVMAVLGLGTCGRRRRG